MFDKHDTGLTLAGMILGFDRVSDFETAKQMMVGVTDDVALTYFKEFEQDMKP